MKDQEITKYLKLPFQFNEAKLVRELALILESTWIPHYNKDGYEGSWKALSLYSNQGDESNIFAFGNRDSPIVETPLLKECLYVKEVIQQFKFPLLSVRLLKLGVGAEIKPHRDYELGYEDNNFRLHIPITTNSEVSFILDGQRVVMSPGECWYTNVNFVHSVANKGTTDRIHLVIDGERNEWSDALFFSLAPKESFTVVQEENYSAETLKNIIEELKYIDEPATVALVEKLKQQLKAMS